MLECTNNYLVAHDSDVRPGIVGHSVLIEQLKLLCGFARINNRSPLSSNARIFWPSATVLQYLPKGAVVHRWFRRWTYRWSLMTTGEDVYACALLVHDSSSW